MADQLKRLEKRYRTLLDKVYPDFVIGVDECGKGSLAGPMVVAAAAWFPWFQVPEGLDDSKKLSRDRLHQIAAKLRADGVPYILGVFEPAHIDALGIGKCWQDGVAHVIQVMRWRYDEHESSLAIVDGNQKPRCQTSVEHLHALTKADQYCPAVQAASILAKDHQLQVMEALACRYKEYGFERNAGYGTEEHLTAIKKNGPCREHRMSFKPMASMKKGLP